MNCAALDSEGNVWLASSNEGLIRYSPGCFASPNLTAGLADMDINAVTAAGGRYYAAVNQGLLAFDSDWQPVSNKLTQALAGIHVQSLMTDSRGRLWCGTYSELGLVRYDTGSGEIVFFNQSNGLGSTRIRVAFELRDGIVAVGTQDGLALIRGDKDVAFYDKDNGLETQSILCIVQAPDGTLLAGSAGSGIYALAQDGTARSRNSATSRGWRTAWCCAYCRRRTAAAPLSARAATCIIGRTGLSAGWTVCASVPARSSISTSGTESCDCCRTAAFTPWIRRGS